MSSDASSGAGTGTEVCPRKRPAAPNARAAIATKRTVTCIVVSADLSILRFGHPLPSRRQSDIILWYSVRRVIDMKHNRYQGIGLLALAGTLGIGSFLLQKHSVVEAAGVT